MLSPDQLIKWLLNCLSAQLSKEPTGSTTDQLINWLGNALIN